MNAERLHAIVIALNHEMTDRKITENMEQMVSALESVVNEPDPSYQQTLAASIKDMYAAVTDTPSDKFSPAWRQILSEMGGDEIFGNNLKKKWRPFSRQTKSHQLLHSKNFKEFSRDSRSLRLRWSRLLLLFAYSTSAMRSCSQAIVK